MPKEIPELVKKLLVTATNNQQYQSQLQPQSSSYMVYRNLFKRNDQVENDLDDQDKLSKRSLDSSVEEDIYEETNDDAEVSKRNVDTDSESVEIDNELNESFRSLQRRGQSSSASDDEDQDISKTSIVENYDE